MIVQPLFTKHGYVDTRVSLLASKLLSRDAFDRLVEDGASEHEELLQQAALPGVDEIVSEGAPLQPAFMNHLLEEVTIIIRPLQGARRELIRYWLRRFELINLKTAFRGITAGWSAEQIRSQLTHVGPFQSLPMEALIQAEDVDEFLRRLEFKEYADMVHRARDSYEENKDPFVLEAVLDRQYLIGLNATASRLEGADRQYAKVLVDKLLDELNLVWLLRYRFSYALRPAHTYFLLPSAGKHLTDQTLSRLVKLGSFEEVMDSLPEALQDIVGEPETIDDVEYALETDRLSTANETLKHTRFNLGRVLAYLMLRECQLTRMHAAVQGEQLGLPPEIVRAAARLESTAQ